MGTKKRTRSPGAHLGLPKDGAPDVASERAEGGDLEARKAEAERRIGVLEDLQAGEGWSLLRTRLEARAKGLRVKREELLRRQARGPSDAHPYLVTGEMVAALQAQIDENEDLLRSPEVSVQLYRNQIAAIDDELTRQREA